MVFIVENFQTNPNIHCKNTRNRNQLLFPNANLSCSQKGVFYLGVGILIASQTIFGILGMIGYNSKRR
jgi:hypothetical protein